MAEASLAATLQAQRQLLQTILDKTRANKLLRDGTSDAAGDADLLQELEDAKESCAELEQALRTHAVALLSANKQLTAATMRVTELEAERAALHRLLLLSGPAVSPHSSAAPAPAPVAGSKRSGSSRLAAACCGRISSILRAVGVPAICSGTLFALQALLHSPDSTALTLQRDYRADSLLLSLLLHPDQWLLHAQHTWAAATAWLDGDTALSPLPANTSAWLLLVAGPLLLFSVAISVVLSSLRSAITTQGTPLRTALLTIKLLTLHIVLPILAVTTVLQHLAWRYDNSDCVGDSSRCEGAATNGSASATLPHSLGNALTLLAYPTPLAMTLWCVLLPLWLQPPASTASNRATGLTSSSSRLTSAGGAAATPEASVPAFSVSSFISSMADTLWTVTMSASILLSVSWAVGGGSSNRVQQQAPEAATSMPAASVPLPLHSHIPSTVPVALCAVLLWQAMSQWSTATSALAHVRGLLKRYILLHATAGTAAATTAAANSDAVGEDVQFLQVLRVREAAAGAARARSSRRLLAAATLLLLLSAAAAPHADVVYLNPTAWLTSLVLAYLVEAAAS